METLEKSRMCRLCGKQSGIAVDIFDKNESHVRKINAILPILVHEMDLLPKQMCHRCSYKLEEFFNFYVECAKTDRELKSQLSWMSKEGVEEQNSIPMVKMNKFKIKTEPLDNDSTDANNAFGKFGSNSVIFPASILQHGSNSNLTLPCAQCKCVCDRTIKMNKMSPKPVKVHSKSEPEDKAQHSQLLGSEPCVLIEPMDIDHKIKYSNNLFKDVKFNNINSHQSTTNEIDVEGFNVLDIHNDVLKSEKLNRALRPRKSSVDYVGPKKKITTTNLKMNLKNKLDDIDMSLVKPVDIKLAQGNTNHPSPVIKLEKVDDAVKSLRTQQNLELFNKRVKELQRKKKNAHKKENRDRRSFWMQSNQSKKCEKLKENVNSPTTKKSQKEENSTKKNLKTEKHENRYNLQFKSNINGECSTSNYVNDSVNDLNIVESKIKREQVIVSVKSDDIMEQSVQENTLKPIDRLPFCALVKLENDYTCNVDYPKIQIRRHTIATNSVNSQDDRPKVSAKQKDHSKRTISKKSPDGDDSFLKNLRSKERTMKIKNNNHKTRSKKKNGRQLDFKIKRAVFNKELSMVLPQSELKCYCERCNTSFGNKELYKLHPCYQN